MPLNSSTSYFLHHGCLTCTTVPASVGNQIRNSDIIPFTHEYPKRLQVSITCCPVNWGHSILTSLVCIPFRYNAQCIRMAFSCRSVKINRHVQNTSASTIHTEHKPTRWQCRILLNEWNFLL